MVHDAAHGWNDKVACVRVLVVRAVQEPVDLARLVNRYQRVVSAVKLQDRLRVVPNLFPIPRLVKVARGLSSKCNQ